MSTERLPIEEHPDIASLRGRYESLGETRRVQTAAAGAVVAGLFIALSPWIAGFSGQSALAINNLVVGLAATLLALGFAATYRTMHGLSWVLPVLGVWVIISPWVVSGTDATTAVVLCNVIGGGVMTILGLAVLGIAMMRRKT